jgi:hypothetical protein
MGGRSPLGAADRRQHRAAAGATAKATALGRTARPGIDTSGGKSPSRILRLIDWGDEVMQRGDVIRPAT